MFSGIALRLFPKHSAAMILNISEHVWPYMIKDLMHCHLHSNELVGKQ